MFHGKQALGNVHRKPFWGAWCKKGALNIFDPCLGDLEKNYHKFSSKNWVYMPFYGVDP